MALLKIRNLQSYKQLDVHAQAVVYGGINTGFILPYQKKRSSSATLPYNMIIGSIQVTNVLLIDPVFNLLNKTINQNQFINVDTSNVADSVLNILVGQDQAGSNI